MLVVKNSDQNSDTSEREVDRYRPDWLLPYMPKNPDARDLIMLGAMVFVFTLLGVAATIFVSEWVAVAVAALPGAHFCIHYLFRILDRHNPNKRSNGGGGQF